MKLVSWNVNGLRALINKGFSDIFKELGTDILCLQETKMREGEADTYQIGYWDYWNSAEKKGYSGTAVFSRIKPISDSCGIGVDRHDNEGRVITLEYDRFFLVNVYTPNSQAELARLDYRMEWEDDFRAYVMGLDKSKPVVVCGDLNVAHQEIDLKNPSTNRKNAGFTQQERDKMTMLLASGFTDTYRKLHPDKTDAYTWWSFRSNARAKNVGWRIDYFIVSDRIMKDVKSAEICPEITGSDHCPIVLELDL